MTQITKATEPPEGQQLPTTVRVTFRVSSQHIDLASERSRRKKSQLWEDEKVHDDVFIHMEYDEWSTAALLIVLNTVHCRTRKVPKSVTLEMLAKIAVIVDYFEFQEAVEPFRNGWIAELWKCRPSGYCRDLLLWILVSHVFDTEKLHRFKVAAAFCSPVPVSDLGLPIPESILGNTTYVCPR
jgi:hypothetical protein